MSNIEQSQPWRSIDYWVEKLKRDPKLTIGDAMLLRAALRTHQNDPRAKDLDERLMQFLSTVKSANEQVESFIKNDALLASVVNYLKLDATDIGERNVGMQRMELAIRDKDPGLMSTLEELEKSMEFPLAAQIRAEQRKRSKALQNRVLAVILAVIVLIIIVNLLANS